MMYEQEMEKLKEIVELCDNEDIGLDAALVLYKEGIKIAEECKKILDNFESEIETLKFE